MSVDTNAVHESIKLALDAADAATDVTTEYNRVKRDHRNLEASVKQIHRYTTIIFSVSIGTAILAILLTSILYFRSLSELSVMTNTSKEALVVFAENVENVDGSLSKLEGALEKQTELLDKICIKYSDIRLLISPLPLRTLNFFALKAVTSSLKY